MQTVYHAMQQSPWRQKIWAYARGCKKQSMACKSKSFKICTASCMRTEYGALAPNLLRKRRKGPDPNNLLLDMRAKTLTFALLMPHTCMKTYQSGVGWKGSAKWQRGYQESPEHRQLHSRVQTCERTHRHTDTHTYMPAGCSCQHPRGKLRQAPHAPPLTWPATLVAFEPTDPESINYDPDSVDFDPESVNYDPESVNYDPESVNNACIHVMRV
eukprot:142691-Pelagomonas_calceolata.AAC.2